MFVMVVGRQKKKKISIVNVERIYLKSMNRSQGNSNHLGIQVLEGYHRYSKKTKEQPMCVRRN